jgi:hypothetical protein
MKFSERYGYKSARETIQIDSISVELRNSLWSVVKINVWDRFSSNASLSYSSQLRAFCEKLWFYYFKRPLDTLTDEWANVRVDLRKYFFGCEWFDVYDFIEFIAGNFPHSGRAQFIKACNSVLETEVSAYRFVNGVISKITDENEIAEIDLALDKANGPVRTHLQRALELLSDRTSPDYRNSIKESISAVESLVATTVGEKGTLGQLVKKLEDEIGLHPALRNAFSSLYGYTSDEDGIRHAILESSTVGFDEAKFFLVTCSAFLNFVQSKVATSDPTSSSTT